MAGSASSHHGSHLPEAELDTGATSTSGTVRTSGSGGQHASRWASASRTQVSWPHEGHDRHPPGVEDAAGEAVVLDAVAHSAQQGPLHDSQRRHHGGPRHPTAGGQRSSYQGRTRSRQNACHRPMPGAVRRCLAFSAPKQHRPRTVSTMTWSETKRRWRILREIEDLFVADPAAELPWTEEYGELFGDRDGLVASLRYRWQLTRDAQLDTHSPEPALGRAARPGRAPYPRPAPASWTGRSPGIRVGNVPLLDTPREFVAWSLAHGLQRQLPPPRGRQGRPDGAARHRPRRTTTTRTRRTSVSAPTAAWCATGSSPGRSTTRSPTPSSAATSSPAARSASCPGRCRSCTPGSATTTR